MSLISPTSAPRAYRARVASLVVTAAAVFSAAFAAPSTAHAELLSFAAVRGSSVPQSLAGTISFDDSALLEDTGIATAGIPTGSAKAQAVYGVNRVAVLNTALADAVGEVAIRGPFAVAASFWADRITITGGSGSATAAVSADITGQFGDGYGSNGIYVLLAMTDAQLASVLDAPFDFVLQGVTAPDFTEILRLEQSVIAPQFQDPGERLEPGSVFGRTLIGSLDFTYDESFWLVSVLAGFANDLGELDAFNSAHFGLTVPEGARVDTTSGTMYPAAVVPVPAPAALLISGFAALFAVRRRR
jgi:hypothetical protein